MASQKIDEPEQNIIIEDGNPKCKGYGIGPVHIFAGRSEVLETIPQDEPKSVKGKIERLERVIDQVEQDYTSLKNKLKKQGNWDEEKAECTLISTVLMMMEYDRASIIRDASEKLEDGSSKTLHDALKRKHNDFDAIGRMAEGATELYIQLTAQNNGVALEDTSQIKKNSILIAAGRVTTRAVHDLLEKNITGVISSDVDDSHFAVVCAENNIPCLTQFNVKDILRNPEKFEGKQAVVDSHSGKVVVEPDPGTIKQYRKLIADEAKKMEELKKHALAPCVTKDGHDVTILANKNDLNFESISQKPFEGVGLVRLEHIFTNASQDDTALNEHQLATLFTDAMHHLSTQRPVTIRLPDVNGEDKNAKDLLTDYQLDLATTEDQDGNTLKGMAFLLANQGLMETAVNGILKAQTAHTKKILLPYIEDPKQMKDARKIIDACYDSVAKDAPHTKKPVISSMVETTKITRDTDKLRLVIRNSDEASIGGNDLSNEEAEVDRFDKHAKKGKFSPSFHPNFIAAVYKTAEIGREEGKPISMCGDCASNPELLPLWIAMDIKPVVLGDAVYEIRERARQLDRSECKELVDDLLEMKSSRGVYNKIQAFEQDHFGDPDISPEPDQQEPL